MQSSFLRVVSLLAALSALLVLRTAAAETIEAPVGGKPLTLSDGRVACGTVTGWVIDADRHLVRPPSADSAIGSTEELVVAKTDATCAASTEKVTLVATGPWPTIDATQVTLAVDDARAEVRGKKLRGARFHWQSGTSSGEEACTDVRVDGADERCSVPVARGLSADPAAFVATLLPAGSLSRPDASWYDVDGKRVANDRVHASAARSFVGSLARSDATLDALAIAPQVALLHAESVIGADCWPASCTLDGGRVLVGALPTGTSTLAIRLKLAAHVALRAGDAIETSPTLRVPVLRCPLSIESGSPLRGVDGQRIVVRLEGRCAAEAVNLHFTVGGTTATRVDSVLIDGVAHVALRIARTEAEELAVAATRSEGEAYVVAHTLAQTRPAPVVRVGLDLPGHGAIEFVPTNVGANVNLSAPSWDGALVVLPIDGVYAVEQVPGATRVRASSGAVGMVSIRVGLRQTSLPGALAKLDLVVIVEPVQRSIREANVPVPLLNPSGTGSVVELVCDTGNGAVSLEAGSSTQVPFDRHDSCRLVFHRERLEPTSGTQKLTLDVDVTRVDGSPRSDARVSRSITLSPGPTPRSVFLHGAQGRFDRYSVRLSHASDDRHYLRDGGDVDVDTGLPSAQWNVTTGRGLARLYATTAIPTGLYRVSDRDHSGLLTLNFGVLARLTWLDSLGREGLLALEAGVVGVGLANDQSPSGHPLTEVAIVAGVGLSVPIANRALATETAVNLHAWIEYEPPRAAFGSGSPWAFVFGPSVSIGNLGTDF